MTFSNTVAQQREQQEKTLKRFIAYSIAGSFVLHGIGLCLKVNNLWNPEQAEPEEIAIVVTEPSEDERAEVIPSEDFPEPTAESEFAASDSEAGEISAATIVEAPPAPPASESPVEAEPIAEEEPEPEPTPVPIAEDAEESVTEDPVEEAAEDEDSLAKPNEETAEATPRDLSNLLEELRRARKQASETATDRDNADRATNRQPEPSSSPSTRDAGNGGGDRNPTTAVGPRGREDSGEGSRTETGAGSTGERAATGASETTPTENRSEQGSRSREISCRGCDFDYPESADGAEGTAQVVVETDERGRVLSVTLSESTGNAELDQAALEQARERVRLQGARAGESYPIEIDFVQPNSEAAERVQERGDRRSITVSEPEPAPAAAETPAPETPATAGNQSPPEPAPIVEPSASPEPEPSPSGASDAEQSDDSNPLLDAPVPEPESNAPELELEPEPEPELNAAPEPEPVPVLEPEFAPEPVPLLEPEFVPEPVPEPEFIPELAPAPSSVPESSE